MSTLMIDARSAPPTTTDRDEDIDVFTDDEDDDAEQDDPDTNTDLYIWHVSNEADEILRRDTAATLSEAQMAVVTCIAGNPSTAAYGIVKYDGHLWRCDVHGGLVTWHQPAAGPPFVCGGCGEPIANCICPPLARPYVP